MVKSLIKATIISSSSRTVMEVVDNSPESAKATNTIRNCDALDVEIHNLFYGSGANMVARNVGVDSRRAVEAETGNSLLKFGCIKHWRYRGCRTCSLKSVINEPNIWVIGSSAVAETLDGWSCWRSWCEKNCCWSHSRRPLTHERKEET